MNTFHRIPFLLWKEICFRIYLVVITIVSHTKITTIDEMFLCSNMGFRIYLWRESCSILKKKRYGLIIWVMPNRKWILQYGQRHKGLSGFVYQNFTRCYITFWCMDLYHSITRKQVFQARDGVASLWIQISKVIQW